MFVVTGFDIVSYFYSKSKKREQTHLLDTSEEKLERFVLTFIYGMYVLMNILIFYLRMSEKIW